MFLREARILSHPATEAVPLLDRLVAAERQFEAVVKACEDTRRCKVAMVQGILREIVVIKHEFVLAPSEVTHQFKRGEHTSTHPCVPNGYQLAQEVPYIDQLHVLEPHDELFFGIVRDGIQHYRGHAAQDKHALDTWIDASPKQFAARRNDDNSTTIVLVDTEPVLGPLVDHWATQPFI